MIGAIIIGRMNSVRKNAMPRTGCSSASARAMPSTISALTHTAANINVVSRLLHTRVLAKAEMTFCQPTQRALCQGVPSDQS